MKIGNILKTSISLPLSKKAVVNLLYTTNQVNSNLNDILKPFDISIQQFNVLRILRGQKGKPATLAIVQELMTNKMSNTTRLIDKLVKKGFIEKNINATNKRKIDIHITQEGLSLLNIVDLLIEKAEEKIIKPLTKNETQELIRLLGKIRLIAG